MNSIALTPSTIYTQIVSVRGYLENLYPLDYT